jgi:hypothetical protein
MPISVSGISGGASSVIGDKSYSFVSFSGSTGTNYLGGFYDLTAADANLTQASLTATIGAANISHAAHALLVAGGVGAATGGTTGTATITVSGTSITDAGVRTPADSEVIITDVTDSAQMAVNTYHETIKKWIGVVTYTIAATGDRTTFNADFNYGLCKYDDFNNSNFTVEGFEVVGQAGANDTGFNVVLLEHSANNWVYSAAAFVAPSANAICNMNTDHNTEIDLSNGESFAYKRSGLSSNIYGSLNAPTLAQSNGVLIQVITGAISVEHLDARIYAESI